MARDHSGGATLAPQEAELVERVRRKRLSKDGYPQERPTDGEIAIRNRPTGVISEDEETGLIDPLKGA